MHPEDYSMQIAAGYFALFWLASWMLFVTVGLVVAVIDKFKPKKEEEDYTKGGKNGIHRSIIS